MPLDDRSKQLLHTQMQIERILFNSVDDFLENPTDENLDMLQTARNSHLESRKKYREHRDKMREAEKKAEADDKRLVIPASLPVPDYAADPQPEPEPEPTPEPRGLRGWIVKYL